MAKRQSGSHRTLSRPGWADFVFAFHDDEEIGPRMAIWITPEEIQSIAAAGSSVSLSPYTELRIGFGFPRTGELLAGGVTVGLSVDTVVVDGRILKRRGKLTAVDTRQIVNQASAALAGVRKRGSWW